LHPQQPVLRTTYFLEVNVTNVVHVPSDILGGILNPLESDAQHKLGIHDFYRYGLWGFCEGYNQTVIACTNPKPGNSTNPVASINAELTKSLHIPFPNNVESNVHRLASASLFIFSCWIIGTVLGFAAALFGLFPGCRSRLTTALVGTFAVVSFVFILIGAVLCQVLYTALRSAMNIASFDILNMHISLGTQMFAFVWISFAASALALLFWIGCCCFGRRRS